MRPFIFKVPAGQQGDTFRLTVTDVLRPDGSAGDVSITFCRQSPPTVTASHQVNGQWEPRALQCAGRGSAGDAPWLDDSTVDLTVDRPIPVIPVKFAGAQDKHGLLVVGGMPDLYTSADPKVLAIDPASGQEHLIVDLQPEPGGPACHRMESCYAFRPQRTERAMILR